MKRIFLLFAISTLIFVARSEVGTEEGFKTFQEWMSFLDPSSTEKVRFSTTREPFAGHVGVVRMHSLKEFQKGEPVFNYPVMAMVSAHEARSDSKVGKVFKELTEPSEKEGEKGSKKLQRGKPKTLTLTDPEIVKMYSIWLKYNDHPHLRPYSAVLPKKFNTPLQWSDSELEELKGSSLYEYTADLKEAVADDYNTVITKVLNKYPEVFPSELFTLEEYMWATSLLGGRVWKVGKESVLFPLIEAFNFLEEPTVTIEFKDNVVQLIAAKDIKKGDRIQVCFTGNQLGNRELLDYYGMMLPNNDHDNVKVGVTIKEEDQLYKGKVNALKERGLRAAQYYSLKKNGPSKDLIFALRVYYSNIYDFDSLQNAKEGKAISVQTELEVTKALIELCQNGLRQYATTSKQDGEILKESGLSDRKRKAVALRRGEKKIFLKAIKQAKAVMASAEQNWDMRGVDLPTSIKQLNIKKANQDTKM